MERGNFFAGLLKGFGGTLQEAEAKQAAEDLQTRQTIGTILLNALAADPTDENAKAILPMFGQVLGKSAERLGLTGKGSKGPLAQLFDPDNFGSFAIGAHRAFANMPMQGSTARPLLPSMGVGPALGPPEMRSQAAPLPGAVTAGPGVTPEPPPIPGAPAPTDPGFVRTLPNAPTDPGFVQTLPNAPTDPGFVRTPSLEGRAQPVTPPGPSGANETTPLGTDEEAQFQAWAQANNITDVDHPDSHYDYRGYWKATGGAPHPAGEHFPDTFKQHGHPTFSVESQYSRGPDDGGHWAGDRFIPPLARLEGRSTLVTPPPAGRRSLFPSRAERQRLQLEQATAEQAASTQGGFQGRIQVAEQLLKRDLETFRRTNHREPKPEEQQAMRDKAYALVGMDVNAGRAAAEKRYQEGNILPDPKSPTGYSQQLYNPADPSDTRTIPAPGPRMVEGNLVPDPMSTTGWSQEVYDPTNPERKLRIPAPDPLTRSTRTATAFEQFLYGKYGAQVGAKDPRTMLGPNVLTPEQVQEGSAAFLKQQAEQQGAIARQREQVKLDYQGKRLLTVEEATRMQVPFGLTREQVQSMLRVPLTAQQANAVPETYAFEREATEALELFKKVWPKQPQPELRRAALAELQRYQNPDFGRLQADIRSMPLRLAAIVQGSRPSETERQVFEAAMPTLASDNWSLVEVPTSYENGLGLLERMVKVGQNARTDMGIISAEQRGRIPAPAAQPGTSGWVWDDRGNLRDASGAIISGPDKPR